MPRFRESIDSLWFHDKFYQQITRKHFKKFNTCVFERVTRTDLSLEPKEADIHQILKSVIHKNKGNNHGDKVCQNPREYVYDNVDGIFIPDPHLSIYLYSNDTIIFTSCFFRDLVAE